MKKAIVTFIIVFLAVVIITVGIHFIPLNTFLISEIAVLKDNEDINEDIIEGYLFRKEDKKDLVLALEGSKASTIPNNIKASYELEVNLKGPFTRGYNVYITQDKDVYIEESIGNRIIRSNQPEFFYLNPRFESLYEYSKTPEIMVLGEGINIVPSFKEGYWEFLKWDNNWYNKAMISKSDNNETNKNKELPAIEAKNDSLILKAWPKPDEINLKITDPNEDLIFDDIITDGEIPIVFHNGVHDYQLKIIWNNEANEYRGEYEGLFSLKIDLPYEFEIPEEIVQGELIMISARHIPEGSKPVFEHNFDRDFRLYPYKDGYTAYLPTHYGSPTGEYNLSYGLEDRELKNTNITIKPRSFNIQYLTVDRTVEQSTRNDAAYEQFRRFFPPARSTSFEERYYNEPFIIPVYGRLTTEFGETRYVNNAPTSYRHSGLDIAAPTGTPILSTNCGKVTLAMDLILTGNTIVIDHGQGLFSVYYHMHELFVEENDKVKRGEKIATVGSTGFSTGPHLHFTMSYYDFNLEPGYFLVGEPITYENAGRHLKKQ